MQTLRPLSLPAVGKILLSKKSNVEVTYLVRRINAQERHPEWRIGENDLLRELDKIRKQGYAYTEGTVLHPQVGVVAIELSTPPGQPHIAIGIGAEVEELRNRREEFVGLLQTSMGSLVSTRGRMGTPRAA